MSKFNFRCSHFQRQQWEWGTIDLAGKKTTRQTAQKRTEENNYSNTAFLGSVTGGLNKKDGNFHVSAGDFLTGLAAVVMPPPTRLLFLPSPPGLRPNGVLSYSTFCTSSACRFSTFTFCLTSQRFMY